MLKNTQALPHKLPETGYLRIWHVIGDQEANPPIPALIPIKLSERTTAWRVEDIRDLIANMGA
jgi:hypothetical protein